MTSAALAVDHGSHNFDMGGEAVPICQMPAPTTSSTNNASFDGSKLSIAELLDENTAMVKASEVIISYPGTMCNWAATLSVASANGAMIRTSGTDTAVAGSGQFLDRIHYTVNVQWGQISIDNFNTALLTGDRKISKATGGANRADLIVTVRTAEGNTPVLNGTYTDTLTVKVGPAI